MPPDIIITLRADDLTSAAFQEVKQKLLEIEGLEARIDSAGIKRDIANSRRLEALANARGEKSKAIAVQAESDAKKAQALQKTETALINQETSEFQRQSKERQDIRRNELEHRRIDSRETQALLAADQREQERAHKERQQASKTTSTAAVNASKEVQEATRQETARLNQNTQIAKKQTAEINRNTAQINKDTQAQKKNQAVAIENIRAQSRERIQDQKSEEAERKRSHQTNQTAIRNEEAAKKRSHQTSQTAIRNEEAAKKREHQTSQTAIRNEESAKKRSHQTSQTAIRNEEAAKKRSHQTSQTAIRNEEAEKQRSHQTSQTAIRNEEAAKKRVHQENQRASNEALARDRLAAQNRSLDLREQSLAEKKLTRERKEAFGDLRQNQERVRRGFLSWETLLSHIGSIIAFEIVFQVANLARHVVEVSAEFERLRLGLQTINEDPFVADTQIRRLRQLADLPGVGFASGLRSVTSLRGAGISFEQAERLLREISNVATLSGATQEDVSEALRQFRQSFSAQAFTQQDLRPILQRIPLLQPAFLDVFGSIQAGEVNQAIRSERLSFEQAFERLLVRLEAGPRANPETFTNAMERLKDSFDDLARDFGSDLLPVLKNLVDALNRFFQFLRTPLGRTVLAGGVGAIGGAFAGAAIGLSRGAAGLAGLAIGTQVAGAGGLFGQLGQTQADTNSIIRQIRAEQGANPTSFAKRVSLAHAQSQFTEYTRFKAQLKSAGIDLGYDSDDVPSSLGPLQSRRVALATSPNRLVRFAGSPLPGFVSGALLGGTTAAFAQSAVSDVQRVNRGEDVNFLQRLRSFWGGGGFSTPGLSRDVFSGLLATRTGASSADTFENIQQLQDTLTALASPASATVRFTKALEELRKELMDTGDVTGVNAKTLEEYNRSRIGFERSSTQALEALETQQANVDAEIRRIFRAGRPQPDTGQIGYSRKYYDAADLAFRTQFRNDINRLRQDFADVGLDPLYNNISTVGLIEKLTDAERKRLKVLVEERKGVEASILALTKSIGARRREADEIDKQAGETVDAPLPRPSLPSQRIPPTQAVRDPRAVEEERTYVGDLQEDARDLKGRPLARYQVRGPGTINPRTGKITYQKFGDFGVTDVTFQRRPITRPERSLEDLYSGSRRAETPIGTRYGTTTAEDALYNPKRILDDVVETARTLNQGFGTLASDLERIDVGFQQTLNSIETNATRLGERRREFTQYVDEWERLKETIEDTTIIEERQATTINNLQDSRFGQFLRDLGGIRQREGFGLDRTILDTLIRPLDVDTIRETIKELRDLESEIVQLISTSESLDAVPKNITTILSQIQDTIQALQRDIELTREGLMDLREIQIDERVRFTVDQQSEFRRRFFGTESGQPPTREQIFNLPFFKRQRERQQQSQDRRAQAFASYFEQASESLYNQFIAPSILDAVGIGSGQSAAQERAIENLTRSVEQSRQAVRDDETLNARQQAEQLLEINREYEQEKREIERRYEEERSDAWANWVRQQLTDFPKLIFQQLNLQLAARATNFILNSLGLGGNIPITGPGIGGGSSVGQAASLANRFAGLGGPGAGQAAGAGVGLGTAAGTAGVAFSAYQAGRGVYEVAKGGGYADLGKDLVSIPGEIGSFFKGLIFDNPLNDELARMAGANQSKKTAYNLGRKSAKDIVDNYDQGFQQNMPESMPAGNMYMISGDTTFNMPIEIGDREIRQISFTMDEMMSDRRL